MPDELADMGEPTVAADGWIILNPSSTYPIGIYGITLDVAKELKRGLTRCYALEAEAEEVAFPIIADASQFRWRELELYQRDFVKPFMDAWRQMELQSVEYQALLAKGDATKQRRRKMRAAMHKELVTVWGEAFRHAAAVVSLDRHEHVSAVTELLVSTYHAAGNATHERAQDFDPHLLVSVRGWILERPVRGCCHICRALPIESPYSRRLNVPVHVGCLCRIRPKLQ
jgi:hypothetical protein